MDNQQNILDSLRSIETRLSKSLKDFRRANDDLQRDFRDGLRALNVEKDRHRGNE